MVDEYVLILKIGQDILSEKKLNYREWMRGAAIHTFA